MKGREIREDQRVARYVRPRLVHSTGHADPEAFVLRTRDDGTPEDGLSVNWLDVFSGGIQSQLEEVTRRLRLRVTRNGRFAEFVVGDLTTLLAAENVDSSVVHAPLEAEDDNPEDPSHALVLGLPLPSTDRATEVGAHLARAAVLHCPPG